MIRRGREQGWLKQPIDALPTWATFHGVEFSGVKIGTLPGFEERGSTVIANARLEGATAEPLLVVPKELIISRANIELFAKSDHHLREVLEAVGDFGRVRSEDIVAIVSFSYADARCRLRGVPCSSSSSCKQP